MDRTSKLHDEKLTIGETLKQSARRWPEKEVLIEDQTRLTYAEWNRQVNRVSNALLSLGFSPRDKISVMTYNCIEQLTMYLASQKIGAVSVPINYRFSTEEIRSILKRANVKGLLYHSDFQLKVDGILDEAESLEHLFTVEETVDCANSLKKLSQGEPHGEPKLDSLDPFSPSVMMHTSGTTGTPKLVQINHFSQYLNNLLLSIEQTISTNCRVLHFLPLFHTAGYIHMFLAHMYMGGTHVIQNSFDAEETLEFVENEQITVLCGIPSHFERFRQMPNFSSFDCSSVKKVYSGGARLGWDTIEWIKKNLTDQVYNVYAMTEATSVASILPPEKLDKLKEDYCIGKPLLETVFRVVLPQKDANPSDTVPKGQVGQLILRSPKIMDGYHGQPEKTEETIKNGWLFTNDLGYVDEEGYLFLVDRMDNMIISGGENIYPQEIEEVLNTHPKVRESGVIGISDEILGQKVGAFIVREDSALTSEELETFWLEKQTKVANFKRPREYHFLSELPKNKFGKIDRDQLQSLR